MTITETDLALAAALYPILVECARQTPVRKLTYGQLLNEAKDRFRNAHVVQTVIPRGLGRRLEVLCEFLRQQNLPDLTALIVNAGTGEVGSGFGPEPERVRAEVAAFDWTTVTDEFDLHISGLRDSINKPKKPKPSHDAATLMMAQYALDNRATLPKALTQQRDAIIEMIRTGKSPEEAFQTAASAILTGT